VLYGCVVIFLEHIYIYIYIQIYFIFDRQKKDIRHLFLLASSDPRSFLSRFGSNLLWTSLFRLGRILSSTHGCVGRFQWKRQAGSGKFLVAGREIGIDMLHRNQRGFVVVVVSVGFRYKKGEIISITMVKKKTCVG